MHECMCQPPQKSSHYRESNGIQGIQGLMQHQVLFASTYYHGMGIISTLGLWEGA